MRLPHHVPALVAALVTVATSAALLVAPGAPAVAAPEARKPVTSARTPGAAPGSRGVVFELGNSYDSTIPCLPLPDGKLHQVRGRLVGPKKVLNGHAGPTTINVLVHDSGTGAWFWNLKQQPAYDYATQLAEHGQTSLVLDRLGYGRSPLRNGNKTCVDAEVFMLHQVVQHLYSGIYDFTDGRNFVGTPHAAKIVVQGHGFGATLAQLEAAKYSDTAGLVLMAPSTTGATRLAARTLRAQSQACLTGTGFAPFGRTSRDYRSLLFRTAVGPVQRTATGHRNSTPCGEVAGMAAAVLSARSSGKLDVPVLVLKAGGDARNGSGRVAVTSSRTVTRHTVRGAGSALPLEKSAGHTRQTVLRWLTSQRL